MNIAKVIVDVPSSMVNQTFDYEIPERLKEIVQPGMRVVIPFGPRKITGFVDSIVQHSSYDTLKEIIDVLDIAPVLTEELLHVGKWLAHKTLSLYISTYKAMLPQALRSTYDKEVQRVEDSILPMEVAAFFHEKQSVPYDDFIEKFGHKILKQLIDEKDVQVVYVVTSNITKQYKTMIIPIDKSSLKMAYEEMDNRAKRQKQIIAFFMEYPDPIDQNLLCDQLNIQRSNIKPLLDKGYLTEERVEVYRNPYDRDFEKTTNLTLTDEQQIAVNRIHESIQKEQDTTFLLHGVTGSGKTEVYLQSIEKVLNRGEEAICLVPEISLTPQMVQRFKGRFGDKVAVMHSGLSTGEKYDEWRKIQRKEVQVVVGARSAIFAPFENLGIIIIDEEHETTYKQEETPRYHARDVAIKRASLHGCPVVLGSATPTLESFARAKKNVYTLLTLEQRTNNQPMPKVDIVDMRAELHAGNRTMFSRTLMEEMKACIARGEQVVLLLNRRGYSTFALCRDCGHVEQCPNCDISLTYHKGDHRLKCHYCSHEQPMPPYCPNCESDLFRFFGTGTERVEEALVKLMPEASVIRMDNDTTRRKGAHERLLQKFSNKEANILLGTQMIAKGLDFENVTLVGVLAADSMLHLPDFRSAEKTFQLITQVSGRAGRHELEGKVIVQTYTPDHYSIDLASMYDYMEFYEKEMRLRRTFKYPPYVYLMLVTISHENMFKVHEVANKIVQMLQPTLQAQSIILGPTPSPIARIKNKYRFQLMVKYRYEPTLEQEMDHILEQLQDERKQNVQIIVDMNPYQLM